MTINWSKTQIQDDLGGCGAPCQHVSVQGNEVEVVESFVYPGSQNPIIYAGLVLRTRHGPPFGKSCIRPYSVMTLTGDVDVFTARCTSA